MDRILSLANVSRGFSTRGRVVHAVDKVSLDRLERYVLLPERAAQASELQ